MMMGSSSSAHNHEIVQLFWSIKPTSILDVGIGSGKWGFLFRERTDLRINISKKDSRLTLDGIEIDDRWITPLNKLIYDNIKLTDIRNYKLERDYDFIMVGDLVEHMTKEEGKLVIKNLLEHCKYMIVAAPYGYIKSIKRLTDIFPHEEHKSGWTPIDFTGFKIIRWNILNPNFYVFLKGELDDGVRK